MSKLKVCTCSYPDHYDGLCGNGCAACEYYREIEEDKEKGIKPVHLKYYLKSGRLYHQIYCGKCGLYTKRIGTKDNYCSRCGIKIDWSE